MDCSNLHTNIRGPFRAEAAALAAAAVGMEVDRIILAVLLIALGRGRKQRKNFEIDTPPFQSDLPAQRVESHEYKKVKGERKITNKGY